MKSILLVAAGFLALSLGISRGQGSAFTYQGRLIEGTNVANGSYDLSFALFEGNSGGSAIAGPITNTAVAVSNGVFIVALDFGNVFPGADRWLEIGVRTNDVGAFTALSPRQKLTPTPYSITAGNLSGTLSASQLSGTIPLAQMPAVVVTNNGTGYNIGGTFSGSATLNFLSLYGTVPFSVDTNAIVVGNLGGTNVPFNARGSYTNIFSGMPYTNMAPATGRYLSNNLIRINLGVITNSDNNPISTNWYNVATGVRVDIKTEYLQVQNESVMKHVGAISDTNLEARINFASNGVVVSSIVETANRAVGGRFIASIYDTNEPMTVLFIGDSVMSPPFFARQVGAELQFMYGTNGSVFVGQRLDLSQTLADCSRDLSFSNYQKAAILYSSEGTNGSAEWSQQLGLGSNFMSTCSVTNMLVTWLGDPLGGNISYTYWQGAETNSITITLDGFATTRTVRTTNLTIATPRSDWAARAYSLTGSNVVYGIKIVKPGGGVVMAFYTKDSSTGNSLLGIGALETNLFSDLCAIANPKLVVWGTCCGGSPNDYYYTIITNATKSSPWVDVIFYQPSYQGRVDAQYLLTVTNKWGYFNDRRGYPYSGFGDVDIGMGWTDIHDGKRDGADYFLDSFGFKYGLVEKLKSLQTRTDAGIVNNHPTPVNFNSNLTIAGDFSFAGHLTATNGSTPTVVTNAAGGAGSGSGTVTLGAGSTDVRGTIYLICGSTPTAHAAVLTLTFAKPYNSPPIPFITLGGDHQSSGAAMGDCYATATTTNFTIFSGSASTLAGTNVWNYLMIE